jgi:choline monooxygenase
MPSFYERPGYSFDPAGVRSLDLGNYGDPARFESERRRLFQPGIGLLYLGHDLLLPGKGHRRADGDDRLILTRDDSGEVRALANLCTHSVRPIATDDEFNDRSCITCPYHQWSFRRDGSLIGGRDINFGYGPEGDEQRRRLALTQYETLSWRGFHFAVDPRRRDEFELEFSRIETDFAERGLAEHLDLDNWVVLATEDTPYNGDWKNFMEVFGDCYHVPPYHPGLASFSDCDTLDWTFGEHFHVQFLEISAEAGSRSKGYADWIRGLTRYYEARGEQLGSFAVAWLGIYPNLMIELYNGLRVISIVLPTSSGTHVNRAHYCVPADMEGLVPGLPKIMKDAFDETAIEDGVLIETRHAGILAARSLGLEVEPYYVNLTGRAPEAGTAHFFAWWTRHMAGAGRD